MNEQSIELYTSKGALVTTKQGVDGAKSDSIQLAKSKAMAAAFGIKGDALTIKRDEISQALKTVAVMRVGGFASNPAVVGTRINSRVKANGDVSHTLVFTEQRQKSASETAIAAYLGMTVEEVRAMRAKAVAAPINVSSTTAPAPAPAAPAQPAATGITG
jgi:hypothetical protein